MKTVVYFKTQISVTAYMWRIFTTLVGNSRKCIQFLGQYYCTGDTRDYFSNVFYWKLIHPLYHNELEELIMVQA